MADGAEDRARGKPDRALLGATVALIALGLMMVYSASADLGYRDYGDSAYFFRRQLIFLGIGALVMFVASRVHYRHLTKFSIPLMAGAVIMLLVLALTRHGERQLVEQSGSPAEFAKLALVIYIGHWLASKRVEQLRRLPVGLLPFSIIVGAVAGLVMLQPDISEAIVIVLVAVVMFFVAGADLVQFVIGLAGGSAVFALVVRRVPEVQLRFGPFAEAWRDPIASTHDKLYQLREGLIGLGAGGVFGMGPGNGRLSYRWLPVAHTDSIFAVVGEELGLVGCLVVIGLFAVIVHRGLQIARRSPDAFGSLLCVGVSAWIGLQALINMAVVTGTLPSSGIALPFISYGGSSLLTCMVGVGIMLSVSRAASAGEVARDEVRGVGRWDGRTRVPGPNRA